MYKFIRVCKYTLHFSNRRANPMSLTRVIPPENANRNFTGDSMNDPYCLGGGFTCKSFSNVYNKFLAVSSPSDEHRENKIYHRFFPRSWPKQIDIVACVNDVCARLCSQDTRC